MGSSYPTVAAGSSSKSSSGSSDSLNGLTFGQKIYFGVGLGDSCISGGESSSPAVVMGGSSGGAAKKGRGMAQSGQPPRCQVEGCDIDLSDAKAYYSRHKVCCMHSKSSKVIVGGIEQRFCQQCSRFHLLAEFDQGKRSCRRRLAGHNERRRKPPPGSLLSSRLDGGSRTGGFLVDFTANSKTPGGSLWPGAKTSTDHSSEVGKFLQSAWPGNPSSSPAENFPQSSAGGNNYQVSPEIPSASGSNYQVGHTIPSGECFAGVTDSSCALSLLSSQPWSSENRAPCIGPSNLLSTGGPSIGQSTGHHSVGMDHFAGGSWGFKVGEASSVPSDLGLCQVSQPLPSRFGDGELDMAQPGGTGARQLIEFEHSRAYGSSTDHVHWSL